MLSHWYVWQLLVKLLIFGTIYSSLTTHKKKQHTAKRGTPYYSVYSFLLEMEKLTDLPGQNGGKISNDNLVPYNVVSENCFCIEVCCLLCDWWEVFIGLDGGLMLNRPQAVIKTNDDAVQWRIYAALGGIVLTLESVARTHRPFWMTSSHPKWWLEITVSQRNSQGRSELTDFVLTHWGWGKMAASSQTMF